MKRINCKKILIVSLEVIAAFMIVFAVGYAVYTFVVA